MAGYRLSMDTVGPPSVWVLLDEDKELSISMVTICAIYKIQRIEIIIG
jgi:hypothetical protein